MILHQAAIDAILSELNPQQREAAIHGESPLLIVAGAGTGKTTTLAHRVAYLIATGVEPGRILLLTFTRRSAAEMLRRVEAILRRMGELDSFARAGGLTSRRTWGGTFHAIATRLLRQYANLIGLDREFTILDRSDSQDLINLLRSELDLAGSGTRFPLKATCLDIYSRCINTQQPLEEVLPADFPWCAEHADGLKRLFQTYIDRKEAQTVLDYDDLLVFWNALLAEPSVAKILRGKFDAVLVDEYQDTNVLQSSILRQLCPEGRGLTVVGDDAQSIYSFRAADVRNILDFPEAWPGTTVVKLEQNYRSTQPILDATNLVISHAAKRHAKNLWTERGGGERPVLLHCRDEDEQTDYLVDRILEHRDSGTSLQQQAILFRASHHSLALEVELKRRNIPFHKYGGLKFIETAHVKDLLAFLRLAENPRDIIAGARVLTQLPGIGPRKAQQLLDTLREARGDFIAWKDYAAPPGASDHWPTLVCLLRSLAANRAGRQSVSAEVHQVRTFYAPLLERRHDHAQARLRDLEQLEHVAGRFEDRSTFLAEMTLDPPNSTQELPAGSLLDDEYLVLSTIHSAKGLEWDTVYVIHAADGNIPSEMATRSVEEIEEERRLFYVALTRAKNRLFVCFPQRHYFHGRFRGDAHGYSQLSRFLSKDVQQLFEHRTAEVADEFDALLETTPATVTTADIRKAMKSMWM